MIDYKTYPEIKAMATVRVINFNDEHEGVGLSLRRVANNGYNAFRLMMLSDNYNEKDCCAAIDDYIAVTNTARVNNDFNKLLMPEEILIVQRHHFHYYAVPYPIFKSGKHSMFSGIYVIGDSSMSDMLGHHYPIGVHNRVEE